MHFVHRFTRHHVALPSYSSALIFALLFECKRVSQTFTSANPHGYRCSYRRCRVCAPKERGIESHPIIINIYTHVNLCASYQWFSHAYSYKRTTWYKIYIDFMLWITSEQASVKLGEIPPESKRPERVYFQTTLARQIIFLPVCSLLNAVLHFDVERLLTQRPRWQGSRRGEEREIRVRLWCYVMNVSMFVQVCVSVYQYTFLKTNNSTVLTTT